MANNLPQRYWDSNAFIGWLAPEVDKVAECGPVVAAVDAGKLQIVTSALTLAEVIKLKHGHAPIPKSSRATIKAFFKRSSIVVVSVNRLIAEDARDLVWDWDIDPKDAIHVATALYAKVPRLETFDDRLIKRTGQIGDPPLIIGRPVALPPNPPSPGMETLEDASNAAGS
jgi:hypothetical protein